MKKKMMAVLLGLTILTCFSTTAFADVSETQTENKAISTALVDDVTTAKQEDAKGEVTDVDADIRESVSAEIPEEWEEILISTPDDLVKLADDCKLDIWSVNKKIVLTQDISLIGKNFKGIPTFGGIFDGQGHTISDANIVNGISYTGLFCHIQKTGLIQNLNVSGSVSPTGDQTFVGGIAGSNAGLIIDCNFKGVVSGKDYVGGIVGMNELTGVINECNSEGYIHGIHFTGGIAGENMGDIVSCMNKADVNTTNEDTKISLEAMTNVTNILSYIKNNDSKPEEANADTTISDAGGIAGLSIGIISKCINNGDIGYEHVGYNVGGIVGRQSGYVLACSNNAKIQGRKDVAGIVGQAEPYITVDLSADIAYQLSEAISKLHDIVTVTLSDAKSQSNIITSRLSTIQQFTSGAIDDVRYLSDGTIDYANGVSGAATEAFSRIDYIMDEASKKDGLMDQTNYAIDNAHQSADEIKKAVNDIDIEKYLTDSERTDYSNAKKIINSSSEQYKINYEKAYRGYYNHEIADEVNKLTSGSKYQDLVYQFENGTILRKGDYNNNTRKWNIKSIVEDDLKSKNGIYNEHEILTKGTWYHEADDGSLLPFPQDNDDDSTLFKNASADAAKDAESISNDLYQSPLNNGNDMKTDMAYAAAVYTEITSRHLDEMTDAVRTDATKGINELGEAADNLRTAGGQTKDIISNLAGRSDITFPQFSADYKAHSTSLANNLQGMNDNFGLLNQEVNNANGVLIDDLQSMADQFNTIMMLYTDAIDGVLDADYTTAYEDVSLEEAEKCMDATIDKCRNFGKVEGDINAAGIAGTMAIEYDFDLESDITGIKDAKLNTSYITKCVLRDNKNFGEIVGEKNYVGGICGLQEMGTILGGGNYANITSSSGEYVGGVVGSSLSYVVSSFSRGIMKCESYAGGIAGDGLNIRNCFALVDITGATNWYGAIAGHIGEKGEVRNNFFVSDTLAGIDRISYAKKAEPVSYSDAEQINVFNEEVREVPYEFSYLNVSFMLDDEDKDEKTFLVKERRNYGEKLSVKDYPQVPEKKGFYVTWDIEEVDSLETDMIITARYNRYLTTLAEYDVNNENFQSQLLVDGEFKEGDKLEVTREQIISLNDTDRLTDMIQEKGAFETVHLVIPDDGNNVHQLRYKPNNKFYELNKNFTLFEKEGDEQIILASTGTMGKYKTYDIEGNDVTFYITYEGIKGQAYKYFAIVIVAVVVFIILVILTIISAHRHGRRLPKLFNKIKKNVSEKIESKEQLFYNEDQEKDDVSKKEHHDAAEKVDEDVEGATDSSDDNADLDAEPAVENDTVKQQEKADKKKQKKDKKKNKK